MSPEPSRLSKATAEAIIAWLTSRSVSYSVDHSGSRNLQAITNFVFTLARNLGLSDLLAQAIDSAGKGFLERQIRVESTRSRPVGPTRNFRVGSAPNYSDMVGSSRVFFGACCSNGIYIDAPNRPGGWIVCLTPGCRLAGPTETTHDLD